MTCVQVFLVLLRSVYDTHVCAPGVVGIVVPVKKGRPKKIKNRKALRVTEQTRMADSKDQDSAEIAGHVDMVRSDLAGALRDEARNTTKGKTVEELRPPPAVKTPKGEASGAAAAGA